MNIARINQIRQRPWNSAAEKHARGRLMERYGIEISDWDWLQFIKKNIEFRGMPLQFLSAEQELRQAVIHDQKVYYVWRRNPSIVQTFLTEDHIRENEWD